ncbi:MAG TPA: hypothetical protein VFA83_25905, partial [Acidimicrobiales bacterium]|nr:hypothetical protein [Acidimicrobiales bacterium]
MPAHRPELNNDDVDAFVREHCFAPSDVDRIGVELEWLTVDEGDATRPPSPTRTRAALRAAGALSGETLPAGSRLTFEPGGQLE